MKDKRTERGVRIERGMGRREFLRLVAAGGGMLVLQACGGGGAPTAVPTAPTAVPAAPAAPTADPAAPTAVPAAPTVAPAVTAPGGTATWAMLSDPVSLEPFGINMTPQQNYEARELAYDSLLAWDRDLKVQPSLAVSFETPDDTTYLDC